MPGFGSGPFGNTPFGHYPWSRVIFYDSVPELHRAQDAATGYSLQKWAESQRYSYDSLLSKIALFAELRDPQTVRTQYDETYVLRLGPEIVPKQEIEQRGVDGAVSSLKEFGSQTARFTSDDVGKELTIVRSSVPDNNRTTSIARIIDANTILTDPVLTLDTGSDRWEIRAKAIRTDGITTVQVREGDVSTIAPGYLLNDGFADYEVVARRLFERSSDSKHLTEREGVDGTIDSLGKFVSLVLNATQQDVGKYLFIGEDLDPQNPKRPIISVVSSTTVVLGGTTLPLTNTMFVWALLPYPEIDLSASAPPKGVVEQEGLDLAITAPNTFTAQSLRLTTADIGKYIAPRGSTTADNNHAFIITAILSETSATINPGAFTLVNNTGLAWELRTATIVGDLSQVVVRASSMITSLAKDFGIVVDTQENEIRQRAWVRTISQWIDKKGANDGYLNVQRITGASGVFTSLFNLSRQAYYLLKDRLTIYYLSDQTPTPAKVSSTSSAVYAWTDVGRGGTDGSITQIGLDFYLSSPTAVFVPFDVDRLVITGGALSAGNNGVFTVSAYVSPTQIKLKSADTSGMTLPETNNGALSWALIRLYTTSTPKYVLGDDGNPDLLTEIVEFAFEPVAGASLIDGETFTLTITGPIPSTTVFEFDSNSSVAGGHVAVPFTGGDTKAQVAASMITAINGAAISVTAFNRSGGVAVSIRHNTPVGYKISLSETVANAGFLMAFDPLALTFSTRFFIPDVLCDTPQFSAACPVYVIGTTQITPFLYQVDLIGPSRYPDTPEVITITGNWFCHDSAGTDFFLDTVPTANGTDITSGQTKYSFQVACTSPPVISRTVVAWLDYRCPTVLSCDYCAASKILVTSFGTVGGGWTAIELERFNERAFARLTQATPAHVELLLDS